MKNNVVNYVVNNVVASVFDFLPPVLSGQCSSLFS